MDTLIPQKERPILFSTPMVQAILEGRKTQTRRVFKITDPIGNRHAITSPEEEIIQFEDGEFAYKSIGGLSGPYPCPYGKPGDVLWVRETWAHTDRPDCPAYKAGGDGWENAHHILSWKQSIHMPKDLCRIRLEITDVRVERLQDISEEDAKSEGVETVKVCNVDDPNDTVRYRDYRYKDKFDDKARLWYGAKRSFETLWQSINGEESWNSNPWVWVVEFKRIEP